MREMQELSAQPRAETGKGGAYRTRQLGLIPAVVYGGKGEPENVQVEERPFLRHYQSGAMLQTLYMLDVAGKKTRVIPRQIQVDPVTDRPVHIDFLRLEKGARISIAVPVHFKNHGDSPGLKRGGVLNIVSHTIDLYCPAENIPESVDIDLAGLDIHDSVHISGIKLPEGVRPVNQREDFTVATIVVPTTYTEEVAAAPTAAEGAAAEGAAAAPGAEGAAPAAGAAPADAKGGAAAPAKGGAAAPAKGAAPAGDKKK